MAKKKATKRAAKPPELDYISEDLRPLAIAIDACRTDDRNARVHDENNLTAIAQSLQQFGQVQPIVVNDETGVIVAGNGRHQAAKMLGWTHIAAVMVKQDNAAHIGYAIADNRTAELATWNDQILQELLIEHKAEAPDQFYALSFHEMLIEDVAADDAVVTIDVKPPPPMTWVLIGIATSSYGEISEPVQKLAEVPGITIEMASNEHEPREGR